MKMPLDFKPRRLIVYVESIYGKLLVTTGIYDKSPNNTMALIMLMNP